MDPKEMEKRVRLEAVFLPSIRRRRDAIYHMGRADQNRNYPPQGQFRCAHYTSADAAFGIITKKRLWLRNTTCMSDYREVQHGFEILSSFFSEGKNATSFKAALDKCAPDAGPEAIQRFNQHWQNTQLGTYIGSMSEHDESEDQLGRLSMWRAFGGSTGARVAIVFNVPWYSKGAVALNVLFSPVIYSPPLAMRSELDEMIKNIERECAFLRTVDRNELIGNVLHMLVSNVTCRKHEGFKEEREWRAIYSPYGNPSSIMECSTEIVGGIPQKVFKMPLDQSVSPEVADLDFAALFDRVIIGPTQYHWVMWEAFVNALKSIGVADAEKRVVVSHIPIRG